MNKLKLEKAFLNKISPEPNSGCWLWSAGVTGNGYGQFSLEGKQFYSHRFSYEFFKKEIIGDSLVCHTCDVRSCVNPDHLFLGDHVINGIDMSLKKRGKNQFNRSRLILKHTHAKLNIEKVKQIKFLYNKGLSHKEISKIFKVGRSTISAIFIGQNWSHVK